MRQEAGEIWHAGLGTLTEGVGSLMFDGANAYVYPYADHIVNVPVTSSWFDFTSYDVPFIQMVLHGSIPYSVPPVNLSDNPDRLLLRAIETGASPYFIFTGADGSVVKETRMHEVFSSYWEHWFDTALNWHKVLEEMVGDLTAVPIYAHQYITEKITQTTFENGVAIYVNYAEEGAWVEEHFIPGQGYLRVEGVR